MSNDFRQRYQTIKNSKYFYLSLTLIITSVFVVFAIRPAIVEAIDTYNNLEDLKKIETILEEKRTKLEEARSLMTTYAVEIEKLDEAFPSETAESNLLANFSKTAQLNNVVIESITFDEPIDEKIPDSEYKEANYIIKIEGKYPDIENFISEVYKYLRITTISSVQIELDEIFEDSIVNVQIEGVFFYK
ncbi:MAG: hypothetical protein QG570_586 [Patescibacteria group bacterium]|nr:hypothetical protein [Patescibacteria group bacterium]